MRTTLAVVLMTWPVWLPAAAQPADEASASLPVREISVFKDGHAFVMQEGEVAVDAASGEAVLDKLPAPILGTFWPYSADPAVPLVSVTAAPRDVPFDLPATNPVELLRANPGARVTVTEVEGGSYTATALEPPAATQAASKLVFLQTDAGVKALPAERVRDVVFAEMPKASRPAKQRQNRLVLQLGKRGDAAPAKATVGFIYVQRGFRWIPSYHVDLDGEGHAHLRFEATLVNDLVDLQDTTVNLVVGVPSFAFRDMVDPISLQEAMAETASRVRTDLPNNFAMNLSNIVMMQQAGAGIEAPGADTAPPPSDAERNEDLFVFTLPHVTIKRGERMVVEVAKLDVTYDDVYTLEVPCAPPKEMSQAMGGNVQGKLERLLKEPKVMHVVRMANSAAVPLTTAPALVTCRGRVLAQGTMTYTPAGAKTDLELTTAVEVRATREERETRRTPNALTSGSAKFQRIDLTGTLHIVNFQKEPVHIEIVRYVPGQADSADANGEAHQMDVFYGTAAALPEWCPWPGWWHNLNSVGQIRWNLTLEAGQRTDLNYAWHYFWE